MTDITIARVLADMRTMATQAGTGVAPARPEDKPDFGQMLKESINTVNATQQSAAGKAAAFEAGEPGADLADVMLALQKADISFKAMTEVRNKLVDAYREIMNMPI